MDIELLVEHFNAWRKMYWSAIVGVIASAVNYWFHLDETGDSFAFVGLAKEVWPIILAAMAAGGVSNKRAGQHVDKLADKAVAAGIRVNSPLLVGVFSVLVTCLMLGGCFGGGGVNPYKDQKVDTSNKGLLIVIAELRSANLLLQEIIKTGVLKRDDAQKAKDALQDRLNEVREGAVALARSGDPLKAEGAVARSQTTLAFVYELLAPHANRQPVAQSTIDWSKEFLEMDLLALNRGFAQ